MVSDTPDYPGEEMAFDGEKVCLSHMQPGVYSALGQFLLQFDEIIREGIFGGVLCSGWACFIPFQNYFFGAR